MSLVPIPFQPYELRRPDAADPLVPPCADCEPDPAPCLRAVRGDELVLQLRNEPQFEYVLASGGELQYPAAEGSGMNVDNLTNLTTGSAYVKTNPVLAASCRLKLTALLPLVGRRYRVRVVIDAQTAGEFWLSQNGQESERWTTPGTFEWRFYASGVAQALTLNWDAASDAQVVLVAAYDELGYFSGAGAWYHDTDDYLDTRPRYRHEVGATSALIPFTPVPTGGYGLFLNAEHRYRVQYRIYGRTAGTVTFSGTGTGAPTTVRSSNGVFSDFVVPIQYGLPSWEGSIDFDGGVEVLSVREIDPGAILQLRDAAGVPVRRLPLAAVEDWLTSYGEQLLVDDSFNLLPEGCYQVVAWSPELFRSPGPVMPVVDPGFALGSWTVTTTTGTATPVTSLTQSDLARPYGLRLTGGWTGQATLPLVLEPATAYTVRIRLRPAVDGTTGAPIYGTGTVGVYYDGTLLTPIAAGSGLISFDFVTASPITTPTLRVASLAACTNIVVETVEVFKYQPTEDPALAPTFTLVSQCVQLAAEADCADLVLRAECRPAADWTPSYAFGFRWDLTFSLNLRARGQVLPRPFDGDQTEYYGASGTHRRTAARVEEVWQVALAALGAPALRALALMIRCERLRVTGAPGVEVLEGLGRQDDLAPDWPRLTGHQRADVTFELVRRENAVRQLLRVL